MVKLIFTNCELHVISHTSMITSYTHRYSVSAVHSFLTFLWRNKHGLTILLKSMRKLSTNAYLVNQGWARAVKSYLRWFMIMIDYDSRPQPHQSALSVIPTQFLSLDFVCETNGMSPVSVNFVILSVWNGANTWVPGFFCKSPLWLILTAQWAFAKTPGIPA